jgi:stage II sporulation protein Q
MYMTLAFGRECATEVIEMNNNENKNNQPQQEGKDETRGNAPQNSIWKSAFAKRWTFPVIYLAASVLIVGLMYSQSNKDASPYEIDKTKSDGQQAGPALPNDQASNPANAAPSFVWPVGEGGADAVLSMDFYREGASDDEKAAAVVSYEKSFTPHEGVDIGLKTDASFTVTAAAQGTVANVSEDPLMGQTVEIDHGNGYTSYYASVTSVEVKKGDKVMQGFPIAKSGNNRFEKNEKNHLHFELRKDGKSIDPNSVLPKKPTAFENAKATSNAMPTAKSDAKPAAKTEDNQDANKSDASKSDTSKSDATKPDAGKSDDSKSTDGTKSTDGQSTGDSATGTSAETHDTGAAATDGTSTH